MQEKKNQISIHVKEMEDKIHEETKALDEYRANRNKYQQNIQQIQALRSRIHIAEDKIKRMEMSRMNIDDIKAACTKEIKVCFFFFNSMPYYLQKLVPNKICIYI